MSDQSVPCFTVRKLPESRSDLQAPRRSRRTHNAQALVIFSDYLLHSRNVRTIRQLIAL